MILFTKERRQRILISFISIFIIVSLLGVLFSMQLDPHGSMVHCSLMPIGSGLCQMTILTHLGMWEQVFTAIFQESVALIVAAAIVFILFFLISVHHLARGPSTLLSSSVLQRRKPEFRLFNYFIEIFSQGILHSKTFELA